MTEQYMNNTAPNVVLSQFSRSLILTLGMFITFIAVFALYVRAEKRIDRANEWRQQSFLRAEKIRARLAEPYDLTIRHAAKANSTIEYRCAASIGVTMFRKDKRGEEQLLMMADLAMYRAKESGRNMIRFADS